MLSQRLWIIVSGVMGFLSVALGAFGAHILKSDLTPDMMEIYRTGIQYQLVHSVVMLSIALSGITKFLKAEIFFLSGIILFSFTLYIYALTGIKFFAMLTPLGGILLLSGWVILFLKAIKKE